MFSSIKMTLTSALLCVALSQSFIPLQADSPTRPLRVREIWSTKGAADNPFIVIEGMGETEDGTILVSDARASTVYGIRESGREVRVVAPMGDGPGEVRLPHLIAPLLDGGVAIYDMGHNALEIFEGDGSFRQRVPMDELVNNPKGLVALSERRFAISGGIYGNAQAVHIIGLDGRRERSWLSVPRTNNVRAGVLVAGGPLSVDRAGNLLFSRAAPHEISLFSPEGKRLRTIASDPNLLEPVGDGFIQERGFGAAMVRSFDWYFPQSKGVFQLSDGRILNVIRLQEEGRSVWELYGVDGKLVSRSQIRRPYAPWGLTRDDRVLASYIDPETQEHIAVALKLGFD